MIFEMRTYTLKVGSTPQMMARLEKGLAERVKLSPLGGFWQTEIGVLNQVVHIWPYESEAERTRIRAEAEKLPGWPPDTSEFIVERESKIVHHQSFSPKIEPRQLGGVYEIRTYTYEPGGAARTARRWEDLIEDRIRYSPLVAAGIAERGTYDELIHIWAYRDLAQRAEIRAKVAAAGNWPPSVVDKREGRVPQSSAIRMENMIVLPAPFSPLR